MSPSALALGDPAEPWDPSSHRQTGSRAPASALPRIPPEQPRAVTSSGRAALPSAMRQQGSCRRAHSRPGFGPRPVWLQNRLNHTTRVSEQPLLQKHTMERNKHPKTGRRRGGPAGRAVVQQAGKSKGRAGRRGRSRGSRQRGAPRTEQSPPGPRQAHVWVCTPET